MEDFPTLQGPRNSTMGLEVISPSVGQGQTTVVKAQLGGLTMRKNISSSSQNLPK